MAKKKSTRGSDSRSLAHVLVQSKFDKKPMTQVAADVALLLSKFTARPALRPTKDGPGITLGEFDRAAWQADPRPIKKKGNGHGDCKPTGWLANEYCTRSAGYLGDIDNKDGQGDDAPRVANPITFERVGEILDALGCAYALHTTYNSCADWPRLRFVIPFAKDLEQGITDQYKAVHQHLNRLFNGALDSRSSPAFMAYLPAVPEERHADYLALAVADRPLFDTFSVEPVSSASDAAPSTEGLFHFAPADKLPTVKLNHFKLPGALRSKIENGVLSERSETLASIYLELQRKGMTPAQIAAVMWNPSHKISEVVHVDKRGYAWLCQDIERVLGKHAQTREERNREFVQRYAYIERQVVYWDRIEHLPLTKENLNDRYLSIYGCDKWSAHRQWQTTFKKHDGLRVYDVTYWPGAGEVVTFESRLCLNQWRAAEVVTTEGDVSPWLELCERLIPDRAQLEHLLDWMAFAVQRPGQKINHHPLIGGASQGSGKDAVGVPFYYAIGGGKVPEPGKRDYNAINVTYVNNDSLGSDWGYHLKNQLCIVEELKEVMVKDQRELSNKLKPLMAAPPPLVLVNEKFNHPYHVPNTMVWMFLTNSPAPIAIEDKDRRFFAIWTYAPTMTEEQRGKLWGFYENGGVQAVAGWLKRRDVSNFDPYAPAPLTEWKATIAQAGKTELQAGLGALIEGGVPPFQNDLVSPERAAEHINLQVDNSWRPSHRAYQLSRRVIPGQVSTELTAHGWHSLGRIDVKRGKLRVQLTLFMHPECKVDYKAMLAGRGGHSKVLAAYESMRRR